MSDTEDKDEGCVTHGSNSGVTSVFGTTTVHGAPRNVPNGAVVHQRMKIKSISKATVQSKKFSKDMARRGMLSMMGVFGRI